MIHTYLLTILNEMLPTQSRGETGHHRTHPHEFRFSVPEPSEPFYWPPRPLGSPSRCRCSLSVHGFIRVTSLRGQPRLSQTEADQRHWNEKRQQDGSLPPREGQAVVSVVSQSRVPGVRQT